MPFIPHTPPETEAMLGTLGLSSLEALFDEIPAALQIESLPESVPEGVGELALGRIMRERARRDDPPLCFLGAGAYEHFIPAAVWDIVTRGEFYSAYTPYQAEASQGTLQLIYEFQSMMVELTGLEVSNASLYDGASALAEACLMACRLAGWDTDSPVVLLPEAVHPAYRAVVRTVLAPQSIPIETVPFDRRTGLLDARWLEPRLAALKAGVLVLPQPNFFGLIESVTEWTEAAQARGLRVVGLVNPTALALLEPPGRWGSRGADIACGEGQPLGAPLSSGGPYLGFMTTRFDCVRQMPGRIVGRTVDADGRPGYTLTLQAREQHIRRARATSNICTNQGLLVTAATLYLSLLGPTGLRHVAAASHARTRELVEALTGLPGVRRLFDGTPFFHECALTADQPAPYLLEALADQGILGGYDLGGFDLPQGSGWLVCATEMRTAPEIARYRETLERVLKAGRGHSHRSAPVIS
jgi:glycine dehydrogenase subunit 1